MSRADYHLSVASEAILRAASRVGHYIPRTKEQTRLCVLLRSRDYLEQSDTLPGSFVITSEGEHVVSQLATV